VRLKEAGTDPIFVVLSRAEIELRRMRGASGKKDRAGKPIHTPWNTDYEKMAKKTAVHECMTWAPRSAEMAMADDVEERTERGAPILPTLPESVTAAMLAGGMASDRDLQDDPLDVTPEKGAEQEPSQKPPTETQPAAKSDPKNDAPGLTSEEIRAMKRDAKERGDTEVVKLCEDALQADFDAVVKLIEIRDAGTQM